MEELPTELTLDPRFAERLREIYKLDQSPRTVDEFGLSLAQRTTTHPQLRDLFKLIKAGKAAIGECGEKHGYSMTLKDGRRVEVMCAYDALMTSVLQGTGDVHAACPHCGDDMLVLIEGTLVSKASLPSIMFWLGAGLGDAPGNPICDHLHLFPDTQHLNAWISSRRDELGVGIPLTDTVQFLARSHAT